MSVVDDEMVLKVAGALVPGAGDELFLPRTRRRLVGPEHQSGAVMRVLAVVAERAQAGVRIGLTVGEWEVLRAAHCGEQIPPHPYQGIWSLRVLRSGRESSCGFCGQLVARGAEIAQWPVTARWGHRGCVEALATLEPPTPERRRRAGAVAAAAGRRRRS